MQGRASGGRFQEGSAAGVAKPNFLIVGAGKSGTTSLFHYLKQIPEIYVPRIKEPHYFVWPEVVKRIRNVVCDPVEYYSLFEAGRDARWRGELSVSYLYYHKQAIPRILAELGRETRIGIILRNPIDRAYSAYLAVQRYNPSETLSFEAALKAEERRLANPSLTPMIYYKSMGFYADQVTDYMREFDHVHVMLADDLNSDPIGVLGAFGKFLDNIPVPSDIDVTPRNVGGRLWKSPLVASCVKALTTGWVRDTARSVAPGLYEKWKGGMFGIAMRPSEPIPERLRAELTEMYRDDIMRLAELIQRDLSHWLSGDSRSGNGRRKEVDGS